MSAKLPPLGTSSPRETYRLGSTSLPRRTLATRDSPTDGRAPTGAVAESGRQRSTAEFPAEQRCRATRRSREFLEAWTSAQHDLARRSTRGRQVAVGGGASDLLTMRPMPSSSSCSRLSQRRGLLDAFMPRLRRGAEGLLLLAAHAVPVGRGLPDMEVTDPDFSLASALDLFDPALRCFDSRQAWPYTPHLELDRRDEGGPFVFGWGPDFGFGPGRHDRTVHRRG